jgi:uncharacterized protein (DUF427 family)
MRHQRIEPGPGQESVWDYPRPPRIEDCTRHIQVVHDGRVIAETRRAKRVLETSSPPVYYIPPEDVRGEYLTPSPRTTICEWKGRAAYHTLTVGDRRPVDAAWSYPEPTPAFAALRGYIAFYAGRVDACFVDGERVRAQAGDFYGGWITPEIVGPFKGDPGTGHW